MIEIPDIPHTMNFWHGGNLTEFNDVIEQKNGRYEYGPGLYLTTHYGTAKKYAKGNRRLYLVTVMEGVDAGNTFLSLESIKDFLDQYGFASKRKEMMQILETYEKDEGVLAHIFGNMVINYKCLPTSRIKYLRWFYIHHGIDYHIVRNVFGWGEKMMVLYNMKLIVQKQRIVSSDQISQTDL